MRYSFLLFLFLTAIVSAPAQPTPAEEISILCNRFHGRGYVKGGDRKASAYIAKELKKAGLKFFPKGAFQNFEMQVNTFPSSMLLEADGRALKPGEEFLVKATSGSVKGTFIPVFIRLEDLEKDSAFEALRKLDWNRYCPVVDTMTYSDGETETRYKFLLFNGLKARVLVFVTKQNLIWTVRGEQSNFAVLEVKPGSIPAQTKELRIKVKADLKKHAARNVIGFVEGTRNADSFIVITAHYDHLGMMGKKTTFPGANDNASGTAMLLSLARYYVKNPQPYSICFMAFAAEEAGLIGSHYYTENPWFDLSKIRFLLNLDLVGTGNKGITVVNATEFADEFSMLQQLNARDSLLPTVNPRGKAANSDHYWFTERGVPSFFIYQMGDYSHYHDPGDRAEILPLTHFGATEELIKRFVVKIQGGNSN